MAMNGGVRTSEEQLMCLQCHVVKFTENIDVASTAEANVSVEGLLSLSKKDGSTAIFRLNKGRVVELSAETGTSLRSCKRVFWDRWRQSGDQCCVFYTQNDAGTVLEVAVRGDTVCLQRQLLLAPLQKAIGDFSKTPVSSVRLAGYEQGYLLFEVNRDTLCAAEIDNNLCLPCSWVHLPADPQGDTAPCFQVAAGAVIVMHSQEQLLLIHSLCDGKLLCQIDLEPVGFPAPMPRGQGAKVSEGHDPWSVTPALDRLVWLDPQGAVLCLDLEQYVRAKPHVVRLSESSPGSRARTGVGQRLRTCGGGGGGWWWRYRLADCHRQQVAASLRPRWLPAKLTSTLSEVKKVKVREVPACGFWGQLQRTRGKGVGEAGYVKRVGLGVGSVVGAGLRVREVWCSGAVLTVLLVSGADSDCTALGLVHLASGRIYLHSVPSDHIPIVTPAVSLPIMLLSPGGLVLLSVPGEPDQEDIVSQVMLHSGAQTTDSLCQLNNWSGTTVPLQALELGLRQHQLDTLTFFLHSKQHVFSGRSVEAGSPHLSPAWSDGAHLSTMTQLLPALELFLKVIRGDLADLSPPREFRCRLLGQTLEFVHDLLKDGAMRRGQLTGPGTPRAERDDLDSAMQVLMGYIGQLRDAMMAEQCRQKQSQPAASTRPLTSQPCERESPDVVREDGVDGDTTDLYTEEAVEEACGANDLPSLQSRVLAEGERVGGQWGRVVRVGLQAAWRHLQKHDLPAAQSIISCLGLEVSSTVWKLVQFSPGRQLQLFMVHQLTSVCSLSGPDLALVHFLQSLYRAYPASRLSLCLHSHGRLKWWADSPLAGQVRSVQTQVASEARDLPTPTTTTTTPSSDAGPYCVTTLHWLRQMEEETRQAVLLDGVILRKDSVEESTFNPRLLWRYWLLRNEPRRAINALEAAMARERGMLGRLLEDYLRDLSLTSAFVQHMVKTHLLRKRVYRWEMLHSLASCPEDEVWLTTGLLHTPHPLQGYAPKVMGQFHRRFAAYCARYGLVLPLWIYCTLHCVDVEGLADLPCAKDVAWFKPFICLHSAVSLPHSISAMCAGGLSMAGVLWPPDDWSLARLLAQGHVTTAVAMLAYLPHTCSLTQQTEDSQYRVDVPLLRSGLQRFPKLLSALLPPDADTSLFDINVYQLLRSGQLSLHPSRLFGWQSTHSASSEDGMKVLPYFSQPQLVSQFAHTASLHFTYYLKHGRPTFAFLSFLTEELEHRTSTLSPKRVGAACGVALWLCVKHFHLPQVSGACVTFVEMLGRDSAALRTYLQAGETVLTHRTRQLAADRRKEQLRVCQQDVVSLLQSCLGNRHRHGRRLVTAVEDAIADEVAREGLSSTSVEAAMKWNLAVLLCHHLHLPLSTRFLDTCARDDRWLPFLFFAHLHQFPKAQLQQVVHQFSGRHLRDHLHYIITNASTNTATSSAAVTPEGVQGENCDGSRQLRASLYSRIGLTPASDHGEGSSEEEGEEDQKRGERNEQHRASTRHSSQDDMEVREESSPSDVFRVIFSALATSDPCRSLLMHAVVLRNPLFAELAGCCNAPIVSSLCAWLVAMLPPAEHAHFVEHDGKRAWRWSERQLERLVEVYLQCGAENTLAAAFFIFQPTSPLLPFLQFLRECVSWRNYEGCKKLLDNFKDAMAALSPASGKVTGASGGEGEGEGALQVIGGREWLERTAYRAVQQQLVRCGTVHDALHLLALLAQENIALVFSFDVLDFGQLHKMLRVLHQRQVRDVHLSHLFSGASSQHLYLQECHRCLESLIAQGLYEDAYTFGHCAGLDLSGVVERQLKSEKDQLQKCGVWQSAVIRRRYWKQCAATCARFQLSADVVARFFQKEAEACGSLRERGSLYKLSLTHVEGLAGKERTGAAVWGLRDQIFTAMWRCMLQDRVARLQMTEAGGEEEDLFSEREEGEGSRASGGRQELLHSALLPKPRVQPADELSSEEAMELEGVMGDLLAEGHVAECCDLATLLGVHTSDLTIILTCIGLSTGQITVDTMDAASRLLLTRVKRTPSLTAVTPFVHSSSSISLASAAPSWDFLPTAQEEIIFTMEQLLSRCHKCRPCCLRIISIYKIACVTGQSYRQVVQGEEFSVLRELLQTDFPHRYLLAANFLSTSHISDAQVAAFLVDEIVKSLHIYLGGKDGFDGGSGRSGSGELIFRPTEGGQVFSQLVSLCGDPAVLGHRLLTALASLADQSPQPSQEVLSMETELLIMAHECHTAACNMEGISNVLRAARVCAQGLASASQYHLMMRLLTGIGRYSEMTYIFDYLQQHHQFEMLLRKGIDKEEKLKTAILDYLKRFHSDDKDTYSMVALNFSMYREIAHLLDECGHRHLAQLKDSPLDGGGELQDTLRKCIQYFGDAAESYAKDKCYTSAQKCLRWARLVNLQFHLLGSGVRVINLTPDEVKTFMATHPRFLEVFVVTEAYGRAVDWADALYNHVLMSGDMRYLQEFRTYVKLTPSLIQNTLYKLRGSPGKLTSCAGAVRRVLKLCEDVWTQHTLATDLGLQDVLRDLARHDASSAFITDRLALHTVGPAP
ncbi:spatacsin-like [Babylonia areolata]|uniref:spatacsin-like n=1 Tax=Babylonia areolata TaxID=304850 RepID=UPI003FD155C1